MQNNHIEEYYFQIWEVLSEEKFDLDDGFPVRYWEPYDREKIESFRLEIPEDKQEYEYIIDSVCRYLENNLYLSRNKYDIFGDLFHITIKDSRGKTIYNVELE